MHAEQLARSDPGNNRQHPHGTLCPPKTVIDLIDETLFENYSIKAVNLALHIFHIYCQTHHHRRWQLIKCTEYLSWTGSWEFFSNCAAICAVTSTSAGHSVAPQENFRPGRSSPSADMESIGSENDRKCSTENFLRLDAIEKHCDARCCWPWTIWCQVQITWARSSYCFHGCLDIIANIKTDGKYCLILELGAFKVSWRSWILQEDLSVWSCVCR